MPRRSSRRSSSTKSYVEPSEQDFVMPDLPGVDPDADPDAKDDDHDNDNDNDDDFEEPINSNVKAESDDEIEHVPAQSQSKAQAIKPIKQKIHVESDSDNDSDDSDEPAPKRRKRGRPSGSKSTPKSKSSSKLKSSSSSRSKSSSNPRNYGPIQDRTCPFCQKIFSIVTGLAYHIEHRVCQKPKKRVSQSFIGTTPNSILVSGTSFVTSYGIVQVIKDERAGGDYGNTKLGKDIQEVRKKYLRRMERVGVRKNKVYLFVAKRQRRRREALKGYYLNHEKKHTSRATNDEEYAKSVFWEYYPPATPSQIYSGVYKKSTSVPLLPVEPANRTDIGDDPATPADSYPHRMVQCVLIKDERKVVTDLDLDLMGGGRLSQVDVAIKLVNKTQRNLKRGRKKKNKDKENEIGAEAGAVSGAGINNTVLSPNHGGGMTLYLQRNLLVEEYNPALSIYMCETCGKLFNSRSGFKTHVDQSTCIHDGANFAENRLTRLEEVEEALELEELKPPPWLLPPLKAEPGGKKRKRCKKLPGWIVFDPELSTIYPVVFKHLKLKRGSNNSKFMQKKWDQIGSGRKKTRKSRAKKNSVGSIVNQVSDWMDMSDLAVYPCVMNALFPETQAETEKRRPSRRAASRKAMDRVSHYANDGYGLEDDDYGDDAGEARIKEEEDEYNPEHDETFGEPDVDDFLPVDVDAPMPPLPMPPSLALDLDSQNMGTTLPVLELDQFVAVNGEEARSAKVHSNPSIEKGGEKELSKSADKSKSDEMPPPKKRRKRNTSAPTKPAAAPVIVDIRPLVEEVRAGRYPSMKVYNGEHLNICMLCKTQGDDVFHCEFCANSEHIGCVKSKVSIRDLEPDDDFMCHRCIQTVLARRARAERRRLEKLNEAMKGTAGASSPGLSLEQAKNAAAVKKEVIWSQSEFDQHVSTYSKCPTGGPGGLICCGACTASYSRFLSETAKEMEVQTLSGVGREVSELLELLHDAQVRLKQALDVSTGNEIKRSMLSRDHQVEEDKFTDANGAFGASTSLMGIMDIFGNK